jgi:hypothetical protein
MISTKKFFSVFCLILSFLFITGCNHKPCKIEERTDKVMTGNEKPSSSTKDLSQRVFVYKPDGSLQCGQGQKIELNEMKKQLGPIEVYSADNRHDGLMRVQMCGQPTGTCNVFEIKASDLDQALKLGFKKWIRD